MSTLPRSQYLSQSLLAFIEDELRTADYDDDEFVILDKFPHERIREDADIDNTYIASGFDFDEEARRIEIGSTLSRRRGTFEIFIFAPGDSNAGENVAGVLEQVLDRNSIPIIDIESDEDPKPEIDRLELVGVKAERQPIPRPRPWEENVHLVTVRCDDEYYAATD